MDLLNTRQELNNGRTIFDLPLRVVYYSRVSTGKDEQLHSLSAQTAYYKEFIQKCKSWTFVGGYVDEGISGTSATKRDDFLRMIKDSKLDKFDLIITKEISRFSRNTLDSIQYTQELLRNGVGVFFQSDNINTLMGDAEMRLTIMSSIAQDEVRKTSERVRFGFQRSIENGVVLGNNAIWGYTKDNGKLVIDEKQAEMVKLIFELYANNKMGMRGISAELYNKGYKNSKGNAMAFSTIKNIIQNPKYMGFYCGNKTQKIDFKHNDRKTLDKSEWKMYEDNEACPPIVSIELWNKANDILEARSNTMKSTQTSYNNKYAYSGKIVCTRHNCSYHRGIYKYNKREWWGCHKYKNNGKKACDMPIIYTDELDLVMKDAYNSLFANKKEIIDDLLKIYQNNAQSNNIKQDMAKLEVKINEIQKRKDKLLDLSLDGRLSNEEFEKRNNSFNTEIDELKLELERLRSEEFKAKDIASSLEVLRKSIAKELTFENGFDENIINAMVDKIEVLESKKSKVGAMPEVADAPTAERQKEVNLKIYFKIFNQPEDVVLTRDKDKTSVCFGQYAW